MDLFSFIGDTLRSIPTNDTAKMEQVIDLAEDKAKKGAMGAMGLTLGQDRVDNITALAEQGNQASLAVAPLVIGAAPNPMGIQNSQMSLQGSTTTANGVPNSFDNLMGNAQFQFKFTKRF